MSIILIVIASIVVLGGTYWYFVVQKTKTQREATPSAIVAPAKVQPQIAKDSPVVSADKKVGSSLPKQRFDPKETPATVSSTAKPVEKNQKDTLPVETPKQTKQLPAPIAPSITKRRGFSLPTLEFKSEEVEAGEDTQTSVLASEELLFKAEVSNLPTRIEETEPQTVIEMPVVKKEIASVATKVREKSESLKAETTDEVSLPPVSKEPVASQPAEEKATAEKPALETSLSVSFLDYNFPTDFSFH